MSKLILLSGIPASGKSTFAEQIAERENAILLSTDKIRMRLFGNSKNQKQGKVFRELYNQIDKFLPKGKNIVVDATNTDRYRRMRFTSNYLEHEKIIHYFNTPYEVCVNNNDKRKDTVVDEFIINKHYKNFHIPMKAEGWDKVYIHHWEEHSLQDKRKEFEQKLLSGLSYDELFGYLNQFSIFKDMYQFNQESPFHKYPVCLHTYKVYEYLYKHYEGEDKLDLLITALLHDSGKPFTKKYKATKGYYSYYGHENVSAQLACEFLKNLGYDDDYILTITTYIQLHMKLLKITDNPHISSEIYEYLGDEQWKMFVFREADNLAKGKS